MIKNNVLSQNLAKNVYSTNENPLNDEECTTDEWYSNINNSSHHNNNNLIENDENDENRMFIRNNMNNIEDIEDYSNEPPLLEELGIRFDHILTKTQAVIIPTKTIDEHLLDDADIAGPVVYCLILGALLLLSGKVHFGYIYGFSLFGCISLYLVINLLDPIGLDIWRTASVLGYSMLPIIALAAISILFNLRGYLGLGLSIGAICWSTASSTRIFGTKLQLTEQYWLVAYPIMLLYSCFVLMTIF